MSLTNIRAQIKAILEDVTGIGVVHDYERWAVDWNSMLSILKPVRQENINGWMITRTDTEEKVDVFGRNQAVHSILIRGIYSHNDADESEKTFQDLIESIKDEFRDNFNLNDSCQSIYPEFGKWAGKAGIQVNTVEMRKIGGVLCHYCELGLGVQETYIY